MSRAWIVYIFFAAVLVGGLWVILTFGTSLRAPDEVAGDWVVHWNKHPAKMAETLTMRIAQSGRFFTIRFGDGSAYRYTLGSNWLGSRDGRKLWMPLSGTNSTMTLSGPIRIGDPPRIDDLHLEMKSDGTFTGSARRVGAPSTRPIASAGAAGAR